MSSDPILRPVSSRGGTPTVDPPRTLLVLGGALISGRYALARYVLFTYTFVGYKGTVASVSFIGKPVMMRPHSFGAHLLVKENGSDHRVGGIGTAMSSEDRPRGLLSASETAASQEPHVLSHFLPVHDTAGHELGPEPVVRCGPVSHLGWAMTHEKTHSIMWVGRPVSHMSGKSCKAGGRRYPSRLVFLSLLDPVNHHRPALADPPSREGSRSHKSSEKLAEQSRAGSSVRSSPERHEEHPRY